MQPKYVASKKVKSGPGTAFATATWSSQHAAAAPSSGGSVSRLQDGALSAMSDTGQCMSMHQPYASLLVQGVKMHEVRPCLRARPSHGPGPRLVHPLPRPPVDRRGCQGTRNRNSRRCDMRSRK